MGHRGADPSPARIWLVTVGIGMTIVGLLVALIVLLAVDSDAPSPSGGGSGSIAAPTTTTKPVISSGTLPPSSSTTGVPAVSEPGLTALGASRRGREIVGTTLGDGPTRVYVLVGLHGDERAAYDTGPLLITHWLESGFPAGVTIRYVANANPDGIVAATRDNSAGVDLNRNFPTRDFDPSDDHGEHPLSEPEAAAVFADIEIFAPHIIVALHAEWNGPFTNFDGPAEAFAEAFAAAAAVQPGWYVEPELPYSTPGSLGTYYGKTIGIPVVTIEMSRHQTAAEHWPGVRAGMDALLEGVIDG